MISSNILQQIFFLLALLAGQVCCVTFSPTPASTGGAIILLPDVVDETADTPFPTASPISDNYIYTIYYQDVGCQRSPTVVSGKVLHEPVQLQGRASSGSVCADEAICLINPFSTHCQALTPTVQTTSIYAIDERNDRIIVCDENSNCATVNGCYESSIFPSCSFQLALQSDLIANPDLIKSTTTTAQMEQQMYHIFYSDNSCNDFVGLEGLTVGDNNLPVVNDDSLSCDQSMACLFNPGGEDCEIIGGFDRIVNVKTELRDGEPFFCQDESEFLGCRRVETECTRSFLLPNCFMRWVTASELFEDPHFYILPRTEAPTVVPIPDSITVPLPPTADATLAPTPLAVLDYERTVPPTNVPIEEKNDFVYLVYYNDEQCMGEPVLLNGFVSGEQAIFAGRNAGNCTIEADCALYPDNEQCLTFPTTAFGKALLKNVDGEVFQCDENDSSQCIQSENRCLTSGVTPSCHFRLLSESNLRHDTRILRLRPDFNTNGLVDHTYHAFYDDSQCETFVGMHGIHRYATDLSSTDNSVSCHDALACLLDPESALCQSLDALVGTVRIVPSATTTAAPQDTTESPPCRKSTLLPSCYVRETTAANFFRDPAELLNYEYETHVGSLTDAKSSAFTNGVLGRRLFVPILLSVGALFYISA